MYAHKYGHLVKMHILWFLCYSIINVKKQKKIGKMFFLNENKIVNLHRDSITKRYLTHWYKGNAHG